ncbi:hypothetical protein DERF_010139 [Dermatophagoides farinae]|uniref:Uncharacterized protein n=1 Tax=Dermatophagoides farinae TaxID=6954 RepID=A0A922HVB2_DERFA|nr:hypothetical protein DERF_010139 [Dermatophagoides farinae]
MDVVARTDEVTTYPTNLSRENIRHNQRGIRASYGAIVKYTPIFDIEKEGEQDGAYIMDRITSKETRKRWVPIRNRSKT